MPARQVFPAIVYVPRTGCQWKALPGAGSRLMARWARLRWQSSALEPIQRTGEQNGRKRSLQVDARGVPLSIIVSEANTHDVKLLARTSLCMNDPGRVNGSRSICAPTLDTKSKQRKKMCSRKIIALTSNNANKRVPSRRASRDTTQEDGPWNERTRG